MTNYLDDVYFRDEYDKHGYPQKLCDYIVENFLKDSMSNGNRLLDIGSGKGNQLVGFSRHGYACSGIDKRDECVNILKHFEVKECDLETQALPYDSETFDIVFSKSVIEHVWNTQNFVREAHRVLKPGGVFILLTPDWLSQYKSFYDDYTHIRPFTRKGLRAALRQNGFSDVRCDFFYQLPFVWRHPWLVFIPKILGFLPYGWRWCDNEERNHRKLLRFSQEKMLLAVAIK
jgi:SAM-dependent methyltransferase